MGSTASTLASPHASSRFASQSPDDPPSREMRAADALAGIVTRVMVLVDDIVDQSLARAEILSWRKPLVAPRASVAVLLEVERGLHAAGVSRGLRLMLLMAVEDAESSGSSSGMIQGVGKAARTDTIRDAVGVSGLSTMNADSKRYGDIGIGSGSRLAISNSYSNESTNGHTDGHGNSIGNGGTSDIGNGIGNGVPHGLHRRSTTVSVSTPSGSAHRSHARTHTRFFSLASLGVSLPPTPTPSSIFNDLCRETPYELESDHEPQQDQLLGITHDLIGEIVDDAILDVGSMPLSALREEAARADEDLLAAADRVGDAILDVVFGRHRAMHPSVAGRS